MRFGYDKIARAKAVFLRFSASAASAASRDSTPLIQVKLLLALTSTAAPPFSEPAVIGSLIAYSSSCRLVPKVVV